MLLACPNCATTYEIKPSVIGENGRSLRCARCQVVWFATRSQELVVAPQPAAAAPAAEASPPAANPQAAAPTRTSADVAPPIAAHEQIAIDRATAAATYADAMAPSLESPPLAPVSIPENLPRTVTMNVEGEDIETFARRQSQTASKSKQGVRDQFGAPAIIAVVGVVVAALLAWREPIVQRAPQMASFYASIGLPVNLRQLAFGNVRTTKETRDGVPVLLVDGVITSLSKFSVEVPRLRFALRNRAGQEIYAWSAQAEQSILAPGEVLPFRSRLASPPSEGHDVVVRFFNKRDSPEGTN